jgi:hypothetical protein
VCRNDHHKLHDKGRLNKYVVTVIFIDEIDSKVKRANFPCKYVFEISLTSRATFFDACIVFRASGVVDHHAVISPI